MNGNPYQWSAIGQNPSKIVYSLAVLHNGNIVAAGASEPFAPTKTNCINLWNNKEWKSLGIVVHRGNGIRALAVLNNGDLVAGGDFTEIDGVVTKSIARWDGENWFPLGSGLGGPDRDIFSLAVLRNGDLVAGGVFTMAGDTPSNNIARWDGTKWNRMGSGVSIDPALGTPVRVFALLVQQDGSLLVGGTFGTAGDAKANSIARWIPDVPAKNGTP